jgi:hypothetical protein
MRVAYLLQEESLYSLLVREVRHLWPLRGVSAFGSKTTTLAKFATEIGRRSKNRKKEKAKIRRKMSIHVISGIVGYGG